MTERGIVGYDALSAIAVEAFRTWISHVYDDNDDDDDTESMPSRVYPKQQA